MSEASSSPRTRPSTPWVRLPYNPYISITPYPRLEVDSAPSWYLLLYSPTQGELMHLVNDDCFLFGTKLSNSPQRYYSLI